MKKEAGVAEEKRVSGVTDKKRGRDRKGKQVGA